MDNDLFYNMFPGDIHKAAPIFLHEWIKSCIHGEIPQDEILRDFAGAVHQKKGFPYPYGLKYGLNP